MAVNTPNIQGGVEQFSAGDGIEIVGGVITNTMSPPSQVIDNMIGNPALITNFGGLYIVPASGTSGVFVGQEGKLAQSLDNGATWTFTITASGTRKTIISGPNAGATYRWSGSAWVLTVATAPIGSVLKVASYTAGQIVLSGTVTDAVLTCPAYTPVSALSTLIIEMNADYTIGGYGADSFSSQLSVNGGVLFGLMQRFNAGGSGGGSRSGALLPLNWAYQNTSLAAKTVTARLFRSAGDDSITVGANKVCTIMEIQR